MSWPVRAAVTCAIVAIAVALTGPAFAAAELPKGQILPTVACTADQKQTYALYVPTSFDPSRRTPILFWFDPGARGRVAVEHFQAAAEKYGWLVAGSNNSHNGPWEANLTAINAMVSDVDRHLPLDRKRIYVAGLSGGARVACTVAASGIAHGVIACSAGFAGSQTPDAVPYPFFGTAGRTDFNYQELRRVDRELDDRRAVHRVVIFEGGHEWLPAPLALEAVGWLELQAMRRGDREKDAAWIQSQFDARLAAVPAEPVLERQRALKSVAADFKGLIEVTAVDKEAGELAASRAFKDALKAERAAAHAEQSYSDDIMSSVADGYANAARKTVALLQAKAAVEGPERAMATRVLQGVASACGDTAREAMRAEDYETAAAALELVVLVRPERAQARLDLARARAGQGDTARALAALRDAAAHGFHDAARVREDKVFARLAKNPEFAAIVDGMSTGK